MDLGIRGKRALVFGASSGLGAAIAVGLAQEGAHVAIAGRRRTELQATASVIEAAGGKAVIIEWDLSKLSATNDRVEQVQRELGDVDILFNNTGGPPPSSAIGQDADVWTQHFEAMVLSVIKITDAFLPGMRQRRWGRILTSTSSGVIAPIHNLAISNALRSSLLGWSKTLSAEVAADGVTANVIVPGKIETARLRSLTETTAARTNVSFDEVTAKSVDAIPMKRFGSPQEYAAPAVFLMSERASYITGSVFRVDGGGIPSI